MFYRRTYNDIVRSVVKRLEEETDITVTTPGGVARMLIEVIAKEISTDFNIFDYQFAQLFVSSASGDNLDRFGSLFGITRVDVPPEINSTEGVVYFYLNNEGIDHSSGVPNITYGSDITFPEGTLLSTNELSTEYNPVVWETTEEIVISAGDYMAYASIRPLYGRDITVGEGELLNHNFNDSELTDDVRVYIYNKTDLVGITTYETDNNYRYRIIHSIKRLASGNRLAIRLASLGVNGVRDVRIMPLSRGIGTFEVIIITEEPGSSAASSAVTAVIAAVDAVKSVGDIAYIETPTERKVDINAKLVLDDGLTTKSISVVTIQVETKIKNYINSLTMGQKLSITGLIGTAIETSPAVSDFIIYSSGGIEVDDIVKPIRNIEVGEREILYAGDVSLTI